MRYPGFHTELLEPRGGNADAADRWVVSYADFITLMFAFFVVMYSVSSVNDGKFRVLSEHLLDVFNQPEVVARIEAGLGQGASAGDSAARLDAVLALFEQGDAVTGAPLSPAEFEAALRHALAVLPAGKAVAVRADSDWTAVEIAADAAFARAGEPDAAAHAIVETIAEYARAAAREIRVEAFSDNVQPAGERWDNNWEKTAAQAAAIATALIEAGVPAEFVSAAGFGERYPAADNASAAGRSRNRRVVISVARHERAPAAVSSTATAAAARTGDELPARALRRVERLPGPVSIPR